MSMYLDTSVLVSCYVAEAQSKAVLKKLACYSEELLVSQLTEVEFCSAVSMKLRSKHLSLAQHQSILELFQQHLEIGQYTKAYLSEETYQLAKQFLIHRALKLRTLDALHLALSHHLGAELFTFDTALLEAAKILKIKHCSPKRE
jgi:uncharacterized protein